MIFPQSNLFLTSFWIHWPIYKPFGNANLEVLATGLPFITTEYCGAADIINDKKNGLVVKDPFSPEEIAEKIRYLFTPSTREKIGENGR
jgi:UDP-glucose:(heptosyl)LPS alpha-1,3-glucosyltransferase